MKLSCADGSILHWALPPVEGLTAATGYCLPVPVAISVTPHQPGHGVILEYRLNGGSISSLPALPDLVENGSVTRTFRAVLPHQLSGLVEFLPVLYHGGQTISPRLDTSPSAASRLHIRSNAVVPATGQRWAWNTPFLGAMTARLRKEVVGPTPDGLRINWHVVEGSFVGPGMEAIVCPVSTDWMRIRRDGVAIVDVNAIFKLSNDTIIYGSYGGILDLGPNGYEHALKDIYDPTPPLVVTPTYATASPDLAWINRIQCIGVGHVDLHKSVMTFDVYQIKVGDRLPSPEVSVSAITNPDLATS